jgi:hypothetical protein
MQIMQLSYAVFTEAKTHTISDRIYDISKMNSSNSNIHSNLKFIKNHMLFLI